jgi:hypothetical protein
MLFLEIFWRNFYASGTDLRTKSGSGQNQALSSNASKQERTKNKKKQASVCQ